MFPEQSRAARGWLGLSQDDLARRANVSLSTVRDFEKGRRTPIANNLAAIQRVFEEAGIQLLFHPDGQPSGIAVEYRGRY
jgi:transcriptional regulator with XRE-family HTH domain